MTFWSKWKRLDETCCAWIQAPGEEVDNIQCTNCRTKEAVA